MLYLLHGAHDDYTSWTRETDIEAFTEGRDLIVAMPDAGPTGIPTAWRGGPDYETFQLKEVPALLARDYRASGVRAVAGVSTGGYGAMAHAARHPGMFRRAASYSGILDTMAPGMPALMDAIVARENLPPRSLWGIRPEHAHLARLQPAGPRRGAARHRPVRVQRQRSGRRHRRLAARGAGERAVALRPRLHRLLALLRIPVTTHFYAGGGHELGLLEAGVHRVVADARPCAGGAGVRPVPSGHGTERRGRPSNTDVSRAPRATARG